jgi:hypothetical protein
MRHVPEHLDEGHGIERRAIGGDAEEGQVARRQGRVHGPTKEMPPETAWLRRRVRGLVP